jgi:polysaccharide export outer membrane protein
MKKINKTYLFLALLAALISSCTPYRKITVFQPTERDTISYAIDTSYRPIIAPNDILDIFVTSTSPEAAKYFNYSETPDNSMSMLNGYLVDSRGEIQIPFIGDVHVSGLSTADARDTIRLRMGKYLVNPSVKLSIRNFKVTVMGEVLHAGIFSVTNEKITLPEALALAGDLSIYSVRDDIIVIRDSAGFKTYNHVDLTNRDLFSSPYYMLHSNDIVYVPPSKKKRFQGENYYRVYPLVLSTITLVLSLVQIFKQGN